VKRAVLAALALLSLTACHVDATIGVRVNERGAGEVRARFVLDKELVKTLQDLGKPVAQQPRVGDLTRAGWKVSPVRTNDDGGAVIEARKSFADPAAFTAVMNELSGPDGPFRGFKLGARRSGLRTRTNFSGDVVLQGDSAGVTGTPGVDVADLQAALQSASARYLTVRVAAVLPGSVDDNAPQHVGGQPVWVPRLGERLHLIASATRTNWRAPVFAVASGVFTLLAVAVLVVPRIRRARRAQV